MPSWPYGSSMLHVCVCAFVNRVRAVLKTSAKHYSKNL